MRLTTIKNAQAFAEHIQFIDDRSLALIMRDAVNDRRKALKILGEYYVEAVSPELFRCIQN